MKKLLSIALTLALCLGLTVTAFASTEDVTVLKYNGVEYGTVTLSGYLSEAKTTFDIEGESFNWSYANVAQNSTCTIAPSALERRFYRGQMDLH